jgi:hypothetical protein
MDIPRRPADMAGLLPGLDGELGTGTGNQAITIY